MDCKPSDIAESEENFTYRDLTEHDLACARHLFAGSENFIRPSVTPTSLSLHTLVIVGCFHEAQGLVGLAVMQDFGIRKLFSDIIVETEYQGHAIEAALVQQLLVRAAYDAPGRILSLARGDARESCLQSFGFERQDGEYYLRRRLNGGAGEASRLSVPTGLCLESYSPELIAEALSLWSTEKDMHLPQWESLVLIRSVVESRGILLALRDPNSGKLVGTILASIQGEDAMLYHLYVSPQHRRCGVGRFLAQTTLDTLAIQGCSSVVLCVHEVGAMTFWESLGFEADISDCLLQLDVSASPK